MAKAVWNGEVIAESDDIVMVEANPYFPIGSVKDGVLTKSDRPRTFCHWKGFADYYDVTVGEAANEGAAWYYDEPYEQATEIKDRVAFWNGVEIEGAPEDKGKFEPEPSRLGDLTGWPALCWLLRHPEKTEFTASEVEEITKIPAANLPAEFQVFDVQRYATRYQWSLEGEGAGLLLKKAV